MNRRAFIALAATAAVTGCSASTPAPAPAPAPPHQPGVLAASTAAAAFAAFDVTARDRAGLTAIFRAVSRLGATVAVGASLFDGRFGLQAPKQLTRMPSFRADVLEPAWCHGDLLLQVLADTQEQVDAALQPVDGLTPRWRVDGRQRPDSRNPFGFAEGAGNPPESDVDRVVWVAPGDGEPTWCTGGTYQVVRLLRLATATWDRKEVEDQEKVFGRRRDTGAELTELPLDAHIRRARPQGEANRILRRGYPTSTEPGQIFVCYQRDLERGFATTQRRLSGEALEKYVLPYGGGYYFTLPGANPSDPEDFTGRTMLEV